ncbi:GNAT family N-acetyltransferase [Aureivirga marina]|uniref:GNAT family N-acetyltransferase n=1 Tax=Aureivirga marina TaxID=1182451 RepID=UPI0018CBEF87|nr:GNAT family N-acetyltransferase [Aureivirga marina]
MIALKRTNSENKDFISLVKNLDKELAIRDGDEHDFYHQFNGIDTIKYVVLAYENGNPLGCGAIKQYDSKTMEIKRMFTKLESRGKGVASKILLELEKWAKELSFEKCILETGLKQPEAIALYEKQGYKVISNYGQYAEVENSRCFEKQIND